MNETRVFADGYRGVFQKQEDFLECLKSIGRNSFWERRNSKNLRLVAITSGSKVEEELKEKYADEGLDEDIITDTIINTGLLLKVRNQYYPVRSCAIKSILDRAGISGAGLRRVEKSVYARILNDCLKVAKGEALLRISEGKVSAVLGGDCHDYAVLDMEQVFLHTAAAKGANAQAAGSIRKDMPVEQIYSMLNRDSAAAVVIPMGFNKGKTLGQVAVEKPAKLQWYVDSYGGPDNLLRAAAKFLIDAALGQAS